MSRGAVSAACTWLTPRVVGSKPYLQRGKGKANEIYLIWSYLSIFNYFLPNLSYSEPFLALLICPFSSVYSYPSLSLASPGVQSQTEGEPIAQPPRNSVSYLSICYYLLLCSILIYWLLFIPEYSINRWMNEWMNETINQSINESINESMNQYFYQSIYLSIDLSIQFTLL